VIALTAVQPWCRTEKALQMRASSFFVLKARRSLRILPTLVGDFSQASCDVGHWKGESAWERRLSVGSRSPRFPQVLWWESAAAHVRAPGLLN